MKRKRKQYSKPKRPFDKARIDDEAKVKKEFGLKNKKEIWRAESQIKSIREKAKKLIPAGIKEQEALFNRLKKIGLDVNSIADVLSLDREDYLSRRLQTVAVKKKLALTVKSARQLIVHKKVLEISNSSAAITYILFRYLLRELIKVSPISELKIIWLSFFSISFIFLLRSPSSPAAFFLRSTARKSCCI